MICGIPSAAQRAKSKPPSGRAAAGHAGREIVGQRQHVVGAENHARSAPDRTPPLERPAACRACWAAARPIWHSRHITFSPLRRAFFFSPSSGPKSSIEPVNRGPRRRTTSADIRSARASQGPDAATAARPEPVHSACGVLPSGVIEPHSGDHDALANEEIMMLPCWHGPCTCRYRAPNLPFCRGECHATVVQPRALRSGCGRLPPRYLAASDVARPGQRNRAW